MSYDDGRLSPVVRTKAQARRTYDRLSRWYDRLAGGFERRVRGAALRLLAPGDGETILEIGFGTGHAILALAAAVGPSGRVCGIDISRGMLDITRSKVRDAGLTGRVLLVQGDAVQLPFATACVDGIFMSFTLELFDTPEIPLVVAECARTLRPRGRICVAAMSRRGRPNLATRLYGWLHDVFPPYFDCRPMYPRVSLERAGFRIADVRAVSLFGLPVEVVLAERASAG